MPSVTTSPDRAAAVSCAALAPIGRQWLPVEGYVPRRLVMTFSAPAHALAPLVTAPLTLDTRRDLGFLSVCALSVRRMGIAGTPAFLRFDNLELLYRLAVRLGDESTFVTLRSDVSAPALALLGARFSHYRPRQAALALTDDGATFRLRCKTRDGSGDAQVAADLKRCASRCDGSVFAGVTDATAFLLGMKRSAGMTGDGRLQLQEIKHAPWQPSLLSQVHFRSRYLDALATELGTRFAYDSTLMIDGGWQRWERTR